MTEERSKRREFLPLVFIVNNSRLVSSMKLLTFTWKRQTAKTGKSMDTWLFLPFSVCHKRDAKPL